MPAGRWPDCASSPSPWLWVLSSSLEPAVAPLGTEVPSPRTERNADVPSPRAEEEIAKSWPRFRGPGGLGISAYANVPETWDGKSGKGIVWKTPVPLPGNNSPVVWGSRVFLSGADQRRREVYCFDADGGKLLWRQAVPGTPAEHGPAAEGEGITRATRPRPRPRTAAASSPSSPTATWPPSTSPANWPGRRAWGCPRTATVTPPRCLTYKNVLLVQFDQGSSRAPKSRLLALDSATGRLVWQVARPVPNSWSTPIVVDVAGRKQIITAADPWVIAYDAADGNGNLAGEVLEDRRWPLAHLRRRPRLRGQRQQRAGGHPRRRPRRRDRHGRPLDRRGRPARYLQPLGHHGFRLPAHLVRHADLLRRGEGRRALG